MPRKAKNSTGRKPADGAKDRKRLVKLWLNEEERRRLSVAAAVENQRPGEFVRRAVLAEAERVIQRYVTKQAEPGSE